MYIRKEQRIGVRYGNLVVIGIAGYFVTNDKGCKSAKFLCQCDCGRTTVKIAESFDHRSNLELNGCDECLLIRKSGSNAKHGWSKTRLHNIWQDMRKRCRNKNNARAKNYVLRGISVCEEWHSFVVFRDWALSNGYADNLTIERNDVNGNYEPINCQWIPASEQIKNTTRTVHINFMGNSLIAREAEQEVGLQKGSIKDLRYRNKHKLTHQEAFDRLFCRKVLRAINAERIAA